MRIIDNVGDLFGFVNAVDAVAFLFVLMVLIAGVTTALSTSEAEQKAGDREILTQVVTVQTEFPNRTVASAIQPGPVGAKGIVTVEGVSHVEGHRSVSANVLLRLRINTTESGVPMFRGERLYSGKELTVVLDGRVISGMVTDAQEPEWVTPVSKTKSPPRSPTAGKQKESTKQTGSGTLNTHVVLFVANVSDELTSAISEGPVQKSNIVRIEDKRVVHHNGTARLSLKVRLEVTERGGSLFFRGAQLYEGQRLLLDLNGETILGTIKSL